MTDHEAKDAVAANVARLLDHHGMTQAELARATGENRMMITRVVRGEHVPGVGLLTRIADAFKVSTEELLRPGKKLSRSA